MKKIEKLRKDWESYKKALEQAESQRPSRMEWYTAQASCREILWFC